MAERIEATFLFRNDDGSNSVIIAMMSDEASGLRITLQLDLQTTSSVRQTYDRPALALAALQTAILKWMSPNATFDEPEIVHTEHPIFVPGETDA